MAITKDNVIIVYRAGDSDSETLADTYVSLHELAAWQKVSVPCSTSEILDTEAEFNSQVLNPLKSSIDSLTASGRTVWAVVLGYRIPGGFRDGNDIVSSTSRVSRIHHNFSKKLSNYLFDRKDFKRFDATDANFAILCSRIDGPSLLIATEMLTQAELMYEQNRANGIFYFDAYSDQQSTGAGAYQENMLDFQNNVLPLLNLDTFNTVFLDPYIDVVIPSVTNDSYLWAWFSDRSSLSFFNDSNALRFFLYNADFDGARTIRDIGDRRWPILAIQSRYMATAGPMSNPTIPGFLIPRPFFETLLNGGTLGEAYMYSLPFVDWTMTLFGDPLLFVTFQATVAPDSIATINEDESIRLMSIDLARTISHNYRRSELLNKIRDLIINTTDVSLKVDLLNKAQNLSVDNSSSAIDKKYRNLSDKYVTYIRSRLSLVDITVVTQTVDEYLTNKEFEFSRLITNSLSNPVSISQSNRLDQGYWQIDNIIQDDAGTFTNYHFDLEVSDSEDFSDIIFSISSNLNVDNWSYEKRLNEFEVFPTTGIPSNFVSRRVRYKSNITQYLDRGITYYFRIRQKNNNNTFSFRSTSDIIYS